MPFPVLFPLLQVTAVATTDSSGLTLGGVGMVIGVAGAAVTLIVAVYRLGVNTESTRNMKSSVEGSLEAISTELRRISLFMDDAVKRQIEDAGWRADHAGRLTAVEQLAGSAKDIAHSARNAAQAILPRVERLEEREDERRTGPPDRRTS